MANRLYTMVIKNLAEYPFLKAFDKLNNGELGVLRKYSAAISLLFPKCEIKIISSQKTSAKVLHG